MPSVLYAVFQEELGGNELQGLVTTPEAAHRWVQKLQKLYRLTHFDPIQQLSQEGSLRWEALYANWEIRETPVQEQEPEELVPSDLVLLALRLLPQVDPTMDPRDLTHEMQEMLLADMEQGGTSFLFGRDEEVGRFVLHRDEDVLYVVVTEHEPGVKEP